MSTAKKKTTPRKKQPTRNNKDQTVGFGTWGTPDFMKIIVESPRKRKSA